MLLALFTEQSAQCKRIRTSHSEECEEANTKKKLEEIEKMEPESFLPWFAAVCSTTVIFEWTSNKNKTITRNTKRIEWHRTCIFPLDSIQIEQHEAWKQITNPCSLNAFFLAHQFVRFKIFACAPFPSSRFLSIHIHISHSLFRVGLLLSFAHRFSVFLYLSSRR